MYKAHLHSAVYTLADTARAQWAEQEKNPGRYHAVVEDENPSGFKIGDRVSANNNPGTVVSVKKTDAAAYPGGYMVRVLHDDSYGGWTDMGNVKPTANKPAAVVPSVGPKLSAKEQARVLRETETASYKELVQSPELVGKSVEDITAALQARLPASKPEQLTKMAQELQKELLKNQAEIEKNRHRDPELLRAVMVERLPEGTASEHADQFNVGFLHALAGKTKSTLSGEQLVLLQQGYEAAKAWIKTEEGRAYYEGKPSSKLQNTGVDLRRHWELMQAQLKEGESDVAKAWKAIERATNRADLFAPLLPAGVKPGFKLYVGEVRDHLMPFKKWLEDKGNWYGSLRYRHSTAKKTNTDYMLEGERYPGELTAEDRQRFQTDSAYRADYLRGKANEYLTLARQYMGFLDGTVSVMDAAVKFETQFIDRSKNADTKDAGYRKTLDLTEAAYAVYGKVFDGDRYDFQRLRASSDWTMALAEKEATAELPTRATPLTPPKLDRVSRVGLVDHRGGTSVTPQQFKDTFGFADVGFGNWVNSKQDQDHLNYAYDAFLDLAKHFGAPAKSVGLGIHFTVGALGHGKFSAHFQAMHPGPNGPVQVINLTNTKGDGTVYHEWTHALDYNLGGEWKNAGANVSVRGLLLHTLKVRPMTVELLEQRAKSFLIGGSYWKGDKNGDKVEAARLGIARYRPSATAYKTNADALGEDYWGNDQELIARGAEAWAVDTLGGEHSYLVNKAWAGDGAVTAAKGYRGTPYPSGDERQRMNLAFTALAKATKWTDGKPTVTVADFKAALGEQDAAVEARRKELATKEGMAAYYELLRNQQEVAASEKAEARAAKERAEQEALDQLAKDKLAELEALDPPKPDQVQGPLSDAELEALFDQAAAEVREAQQEQPEAPTPGEPQATPDAEHGAWSKDELTALLAEADDADLLALGGGGGIEGVPTIHELGNLGDTKFLGFGMFETKGVDAEGKAWSLHWNGGGAMGRLASGKPYTNVKVVGPGVAPFPAGIRSAIEGALMAQQARTLPKALQERADKIAAKNGTPTAAVTPPSASALIADAAKHGVTGINESLIALTKLFGGGSGRLNSFPAGFDQDAYAKAKPHFEASLKAFQAAGKSLKDLFAMLIQHFGDGVKMYAVQFAKEQNLTANLGQPQDAAVQSPSSKVARWVQDKLASNTEFKGQELFDFADTAFAGTQAEGKYTPKDAYDAMEMGMNRYILANPSAFTPAATRAEALQTVARLQQLTQLLATQTKRTAEMDEFQQFSTVPAFAYLANWVAGVTPNDVMLEPSAGVGGLSVFARNAGAQLVLNELSSRRAAVLQEVFPTARVFHENAEQLHNILPADVRPTVVVMNPPFSASAGRLEGERNTKLGAQHVEQALKRLEDGGRLVAIVGEGMTMDKAAFKGWWKQISAQYDVRAVIPVDGKGYAKYGTTFSNALLVIDKAKPKNRTIINTPAENYAALVGILAEIQNDRLQTTPAADRSAEQDAAESARQDAVPAGGSQDGVGPSVGQLDVLGGRTTTVQPPMAGAGDRSGGDGDRVGRPGAAVRNPGSAGDGGRGNTGGSSAVVPEQRDGLDNSSQQPSSGVSLSGATNQSGELTDSIFESYQPQRLQIPGAKAHPGALVQSAAMASVLPPAATYTPNLPKETITEGKLSLAQLEAVVYAGQAHQEFLDDKVDADAATKLGLKDGTAYRRGFFIGDGTGVGKGREIGGIILDNQRQGRKKAIWISEKSGLLEAAKRDFEGVGGDPALVFGQKATKATEATINNGDGILFTTYTTLKMGGDKPASGKPATKGQLEKAFPPGTRVVLSNGVAGELTSWGKGSLTIDTDDGRQGTVPYSSKVASIGGMTDFLDGDAVRNRAAGVKTKTTSTPSRLDQIINWVGKDYDGVIAFDESHNAGNAEAIKGERGSSEPSQQALAMIDLQRRLPNARVVYVSATGATTVENLAYANRLGLWGAGTPFASVKNFVAEMVAGGLATMELVARDMKQMGAYMARSLSFDGVSYGRLEHELSPLQTDIYNRMAEAWQVTLQNFDKALALTGATEEVHGRPVTRNKDAKNHAKAAYWGAQQRFFNQIITSMQMPTVLEQMERDLAAGHALVLQLVNTNEAQQDRAVEKRKAEGESLDLEDLDLTPRDQLLQLVEKSFPTVQMQEELDDKGNKVSVPVKDAKGDVVHNREAVALRDKLLNDLKEIRVPDGPLEMILNHFGVDNVAEVTGRSQRVVRKADKDGKIKAQLEARGSSAAMADAESFLGDKKKILIFSNAGGTGYSFHADLTKTNQRKRQHYLIQPGWRADKVIQGLGRSHRTNQKSAPHFWLASTNIPAHKRFLSAIARRLDMLGAMTKGQRDSANQGMFSEKDNLESKYATQAVHQFITDVQRGQITGLSFAEFTKQTGLDNMVNPNTGQLAESNLPSTGQFLNRMLSLTLDMQDKVFNAFIARMEEKIDVAIQRGELDGGMETIKALSTKVVSDEVIYTDPKSGADTRLIQLEMLMPNTRYSLPNAITQGGKIEWVTNAKSGRVWAKVLSGTTTLKSGAVVDRFRMLGTGGTQILNADKFTVTNGVANFTPITAEAARDLWKQETDARPDTVTDTQHMIVGALLPIWDRLKTNSSALRVVRTQTEDGQRLLGRVVADKDVAEIRKRLNIASPESKLAPAEVMRRILKGEVAELANGWKMARATVAGELRIELSGMGGYEMSGETGKQLVSAGAIKERISWTDRLFVPTGAAGVPLLETLFKSKPLVSLTNPNAPKPAQGGTEGEAQFSRVQKASAGLPTQQVQSIADSIKARWRNAPEIVVATGMADAVIPQEVRDHDQAQRSLGATGNPEAFYYGGRVYLLADQLASPGEVVKALFHETLGHAGLRGVFGQSLVPILKQLAGVRRTQVQAKADAYGLDMNQPEDVLAAAEEVLAEMAQTQPNLGFVQRAIAAIRNWLRANVPGFKELATTDADIIQQYILPARRFIEAGKSNGADRSMPAYSRQAMSDLANRVTDTLGQTFNHPGKLSWWDKSVGSMYHLAQRNEGFKRVFTAAQNFINDVSFYGTESSDMAPKILPRLDTWGDMLKSPISAADNKAIAAPILQGTLDWARDESGKAVAMDALHAKYDKMSDGKKAQMLLKNHLVTADQLNRWLASPLDVYTGAVRSRFEAAFLTPGVVWTDNELTSMFQLTPAQIGLYREFRAATDKSLDTMGKADLLRMGGKDVESLRDMVMQAKDVDEAAMLLRDYMFSLAMADDERKDTLNDGANGMVTRADKINRLKKQGYAPLSRFGRYTVDVVVDGERKYFSLFETARAAHQMATKMRGEFGAANVVQGTLSQREFEQFKGITPESLEIFGNMLGLDSTGDQAQDKVFQTYLKLTKANRSALKRLIHRKGVAGYSDDVGRMLAAFVYSNARQTAAALHMGELGEAVNQIPKGEGELKDAAIELASYIKEPREEAHALRGMLFAQYLGGSVASAFVNFTQPFTVSFPYLSQFGGATQAGAQLVRAMKDQRSSAVLEAGLAKALRVAEEQGVVAPQEVHQLMAQARGMATLKTGDGTQAGEAMTFVGNNFAKLALGWGKLFGMAEQINRRSTFIAAYRVAVAQKIRNPEAFATKAVNETQFINNKANKAQWARGPIGATLMTFKSYSINYLELLHRMATQRGPEGKKAAALMVAMLILSAGTGGLPFMEDVEDLIDFFGQRLGYNLVSKKAKQAFLENLFGSVGGQFIDHGLTGLPGSPIDVSGRMSMANLIPGTGMLLKKRDHTQDVAELAGPAGDLLRRAFQAGDQALAGDVFKAALTIAPKAVSNFAKGVDMAHSGMYKDAKGYKVLDATGTEAAMKMIGFQPATVKNIQESNYLQQRTKDFYNQNLQDLRARMANAIFTKDADERQAVLQTMATWNQQNPDQRITLDMPSVLRRVKEMSKSKDQRIADTAPKGLRAAMRAESAKVRESMD